MPEPPDGYASVEAGATHEGPLNDEGRVSNVETRRDPPRGRAGKSALREIVETVLVALVIALLIRHFIVEVFVVEGHSMEPTLHHGERLLVNKFIYRFRAPQRGDIIVFRYPYGSGRDFIKRVIAVGGDRVEARDDVVYVNGKPLDEPYLRYRHTGTWAPRVIPPGFLWVMGDNRDNSEDSRVFGEISLQYVKGKAFLRFWPFQRWSTLAADSSPPAFTALAQAQARPGS